LVVEPERTILTVPVVVVVVVQVIAQFQPAARYSKPTVVA
jgi:hypothetical protein